MSAISYAEFETDFGRTIAAADTQGLQLLMLTAAKYAVNLPRADWQLDESRFDTLRRQLHEYACGARHEFTVQLNPAGTKFQHQVWDELQRIAWGETISYSELARRIGKPDAIRAVGMANGRNPIHILIPCHRVIGSDGALRGYAGGLDMKERLLLIEGHAGHGRQGGLFEKPAAADQLR